MITRTSTASRDLVSKELSAIRHGYPNVLLVGPPEVNESLLLELLPFCRTPRHLDARVSLRPDAGTFVLRDVGTLDAMEQADLLPWIEQTSGRVQLITMTTVSLFSLVTSGIFRADLFYRLNVITLMTS